MGADCSGVTGAIASNVAVPNGVSNDFTISYITRINNFIDDKGFKSLNLYLLHQMHRGGQILADITKDRKVKSLQSLIYKQ